MKLIIKYVSFILLFNFYNLWGQASNPTSQATNQNRLDEITKEIFTSKEALLKESIKNNPDSKSFFELAKLCAAKNTISGRAEAREYLRSAIFKDPKNLDYRFLLAEVMDKISSGMAYNIYKEIIDIDSTSSKALYKLGRIKEEDFDDFHNSVFKDGDDPSLSYEKFAEKDFFSAENFFIKAIKYDSLNREAYLHLSFLYEDDGKPEKGISLLTKLLEFFPNDEDTHLYLGLLYYETSKIDNSFKEYQKALTLMPDSEKEDFTYNSVKELLKPIFGDKYKDLTETDFKEIINYFWKITDPLYITNYNERLLEHYSRVAYANLRYSLHEQKIPGWKTDRGEIVLRYGEPLKKIRLRPHINAGGRTEVDMKTDVWYYKNFTLGFTDQFFNNNFIYSEPEPGSRYIPQFAGETPMLVNYLKKVQYQSYTPKFDGPTFEIPYIIAQFRDDRFNYTDVYINYGLEASDSIKKGNQYLYNHEWGLFYFDSVYNPIVQQKGDVSGLSVERKINIKGNDLLVNTLEMSVYPDSGNLAFEIERKIDKGVSSNHFEFNPKKFKTNELDISDIILASKISDDIHADLPMKRNKISILPNPTDIFSSTKPIHIYYELYNLKLDKNGFTNFEQKLVLRKKDQSAGISKALNSMLNVIGLGKQKEEVIITNKYQTQEKNPQINFQYDMHNYLPGDYILTLIITDNITGEEVSKGVMISIR